MKSQKVFLVHGHDFRVLRNVRRFLKEQLGLDVVILRDEPNRGMPTIIEKLEANSADVRFAVILLTPDDVGASKKRRRKLNKRARQNVIMELGYFIGKLGRNNVSAIYVKDVERPTDFEGMLYIPYDRKWRSKLTMEIEAAGIKVNQRKFKVADEERAVRDPLTGVLNRRFFEHSLLAECERANVTHGMFSVMFVDIDNLKAFNDHHGHVEGDMIVVRVGKALDKSSSRGQIVSRVGGDEFAILAPGTGPEQARQMAVQLKSALRSDNLLRARKITVSFGLASYPQDGTTPEELQRVADERLYRSKQARRNRQQSEMR